ncbi:hypothetical protein [Kibdelosporangium phytohabitans]|uniref:hypothetical protein n=1 Tax=Kibdelosporangium phytohabitans TaxID=860235 RepID=UPI0019E5E164|nr:hypothetical protein [Kibdelosporangium phytohabitans]MBE1465131.1 glyoxylase-like metal-dependent hydrolase (beta-lactamase superfamily II) [Kibdelosporangium phytohabitans]
MIRDAEPVTVADGVIAHPLTGHTRGSVPFLVDERYRFTGDSVYWSRELGDLEIAETVTWYSVELLAESLAASVGRLRFE